MAKITLFRQFTQKLDHPIFSKLVKTTKQANIKKDLIAGQI